MKARCECGGELDFKCISSVVDKSGEVVKGAVVIKQCTMCGKEYQFFPGA